MVKFEWSDKMSVGNDRIDQQHKEIIDNANALLIACREGVGVGQIPETMQFLGKYISEHFRDEEQLQVSIGYPGYEAHKSEHIRFARTYGTLRADFDKKGSSLALAIKTSSYVIEWFKEHLNGPDRELGRYIKSRN